jgi:hypothetical protein
MSTTIVRLEDADRWVTFEMNTRFATMRNSLGEKVLLCRDDAENRIKTLRNAGWQETKTS